MIRPAFPSRRVFISSFQILWARPGPFLLVPMVVCGLLPNIERLFPFFPSWMFEQVIWAAIYTGLGAAALAHIAGRSNLMDAVKEDFGRRYGYIFVFSLMSWAIYEISRLATPVPFLGLGSYLLVSAALTALFAPLDAIIISEHKGLSALRASFELTSGYQWKLAILGLLVAILGLAYIVLAYVFQVYLISQIDGTNLIGHVFNQAMWGAFTAWSVMLGVQIYVALVDTKENITGIERVFE